MAFTVPNESNATHESQAGLDSGDLQIITNAISGNGVISGLEVFHSLAMTIGLSAGTIRVNSINYDFSSHSLLISDNNDTNPRFTLVYANSTETSLVNGNSDEFPVYPNIPDDSVVLASIYVPAGTDTTLPSGTILDKRVMVKEAIVDATEEVSGIVEIATQEEADDSSVDDKVLVPSTVHGLFSNNISLISNANPPKLPNVEDHFINLNSTVVLFRQNEEFTLHTDNGSAQGIAVTNYRVYVSDNVDDKIYVYDHQGNRYEDEEFDLDSGNGASIAMDIYEDRIYVADLNANKAFVYNFSGERESTEEISFHNNNADARGIYVNIDYIYVLDATDRRVYVYNRVGGVRQTGEEFILHADNANAEGITFTSDRIYVTDSTDDKIYVYNLSGTRQSGEEFDLNTDNTSPMGFTSTSDRLYVVDIPDKKVYVYDFNGERKNFTEFDLDTDNNGAKGIGVTSTRIYILEAATTNSIFVYDHQGNRQESEEFNLLSSPDYQGLSVANNKIYVVPFSANARVYVYDLDGNSISDEGFSIPSRATGITVTDSKIYIHFASTSSLTVNTVRVYDLDGNNISDENFSTNIINTSGSGLALINNKVYILDSSDNKVYVYDLDGNIIINEGFDLNHDQSEGGISILDRTMYIADNNNNKVYLYDIIEGTNKIWKWACCNWDEVDSVELQIWPS